jgi:hypothetical protein
MREEKPTPKPKLCPHCNKEKELVWTTDPYQEDINNIRVWNWFCEDCYHDFVMEI